MTIQEKIGTKEVFSVYETIFQSIVKDVFTFGSMFALIFLNHRYLGDSGVVNFTICFCIIVSLCGVTFRKKKSVDEAIAFFQEMKSGGTSCNNGKADNLKNK